jgi:hypothetical protein
MQDICPSGQLFCPKGQKIRPSHRCPSSSISTIVVQQTAVIDARIQMVDYSESMRKAILGVLDTADFTATDYGSAEELLSMESTS